MPATMIDDYSHSTNSIIYITESIPGPKENTKDYEMLLDKYNSQYTGCVCKEGCNTLVCDCLRQSHGINYERYLDADGKVKFKICLKHDGYPIYECTSQCHCNHLCTNKVVQKGPIEGLIVRPCKNTEKGLGLFNQHLIIEGSFVCEYAGEILTKTQALTRIEENKLHKRDNYIFCLNEHSSTERTQTFIDPRKFGNIGRYINHSCDPNCCVVPVRCDTLIPKLAIFTCKDIQSNEEITFRYGTYSPANSVQNKALPIKCYCNSPECQGYLPFNDF